MSMEWLTSDEPDEEIVETREPASREPPPEGQVRVEFLDGAFKGKIKLVSTAQAAALRDRVKRVDG